MKKIKGEVLSEGAHGNWVKTKAGVIWVSRNRKTRKEDEKNRKIKIPDLAWGLMKLYR